MARCIVCDQGLMEAGGYGGTGMCGPCCTGEADSLGDAGGGVIPEVPKHRRRSKRRRRGRNTS